MSDTQRLLQADAHLAAARNLISQAIDNITAASVLSDQTPDIALMADTVQSHADLTLRFIGLTRRQIENVTGVPRARRRRNQTQKAG